ncbi:MAG: hypothetical protein HY796_05995 [Elusimicrobia bacterium]|nr:hypothetical protein [Elusimicrobiota bacterium]
MTRTGLSLTSGQAYYFTVKAENGAGLLSPAAGSNGLTADLAAPNSSVSALNQYTNAASFSVQWSASDSGGSNLALAPYDVQYKAGAGSWTNWPGYTGTAAASAVFGPASPVTVQHGQTYYFMCRAKDTAGNIEAYPGAPDAFITVDLSSPSAPVVTSPAHQEDVWNITSNDPQFDWSGASDSGSGIAGYSYELHYSQSFTPDTALEPAGASKSYVDVPDGIWYFHIRTKDNAGNWSPTATYGAVKLDLTAPTFTAIGPSRDPAKGGQTTLTIVASEQMNESSATITQNGGPATNVPLASSDKITWSGVYDVISGFDGAAAINVSGHDLAGKPGSGSAVFQVDTIAPSTPAITWATHPENTPTSNNAPAFTWSLSADPGGSGVAGYSYAFNQLQTYDLDTTTETTAASVSSSTADGTYWFHLRGADNAGNGSEIVRYKFIVDVTSPVYITSYSHDPAKAGKLALTVNAGESLTQAPTVSVRQNGQSDSTQLAMTSSDNAVWTGDYTVVPGYDGTAAVALTGVDLANNTGTGNSSFQADTIEPSASITLSPGGSLRTGLFTLTLTITDATPINGTSVLTFSPPGQQPVAVPLTGSDKSWMGQSYIESTMSTGTAVFNFSAEDAAGNAGTAITAGGTFNIDTAVSSTTGGVVINSDNTGVDIPSGAYDGGSLIVTIGTPDSSLPDIVEADKNTPRASPVRNRNLCREFNAKNSVTGAAVTTFSAPVTLSVYYPDADNDGMVDGGNVRESKLKLFRLNAAGRRWEEVSGATPDFTSNKITAAVTHFSIYSILNVTPDSTIYPIPWKPGSGGNFDSPNIALHCPVSSLRSGILFDYLPAEAEIRIYNYQGDLLRGLKLTAADAGCKVWDGKNAAGRDVASGIYLAVIKTPAGGKTIRKLAIER